MKRSVPRLALSVTAVTAVLGALQNNCELKSDTLDEWKGTAYFVIDESAVTLEVGEEKRINGRTNMETWGAHYSVTCDGIVEVRPTAAVGEFDLVGLAPGKCTLTYYVGSLEDSLDVTVQPANVDPPDASPADSGTDAGKTETKS
jgi:hypothetical protein